MGDLWLAVDWLRVLVDRARRMVARRESTLASYAVISDVPFSSSSCPIRRTTHGPRAEGQSRPAVGAAPQAAPAPVIGPLDELRAPRIRFDIAAQGEKVAVIGHGKTFESTLVKVSAAAAVIVFVVTTHVRHADPTQPAAQCVVGIRPHDEMPMIGHQAIGEKFHRKSLQALAQHLLEGGVVGRFMEQSHPPVPPIENVIDQARFDGPRGSWHANKLSPPPRRVNISDVPFLGPHADCARLRRRGKDIMSK